MKWYYEILTFIQSAAPDLRATRAVSLALLSAAIISRRQLSLGVFRSSVAFSVRCLNRVTLVWRDLSPARA